MDVTADFVVRPSVRPSALFLFLPLAVVFFVSWPIEEGIPLRH